MFTHYAFYMCIFSHYIMHVIAISIYLNGYFLICFAGYSSPSNLLMLKYPKTKFLDLFSIITPQMISSRPGFKNHLLMAHTLVSPA